MTFEEANMLVLKGGDFRIESHKAFNRSCFESKCDFCMHEHVCNMRGVDIKSCNFYKEIN